MFANNETPGIWTTTYVQHQKPVDTSYKRYRWEPDDHVKKVFFCLNLTSHVHTLAFLT